MRGIFVTGTDTGIGKTIVSAALMNVFRKSEEVCYWKPIQTGIEEDNDTETVSKLANCSGEEIHDIGVRLEKPLSPHLSAKLAAVRVSVNQVIKDWSVSIPACDEGDSPKRFWIVEGAGGILVPLNEKELMLDLIKALKLPTVIVVRSGLGTINHTLLTLEKLRHENLEIAGVIMNGEPNLENKKAIEHFGKVRVLAELPKFEKLDAETLKNWTDGIELWQ